jgi:hypothetical protein
MKIRRTVAAVATLGAAVSVIAAPAAQASVHSAKRASGKEYFLITVAGNTHESVIAHGLFTGAGKDDATHDNYDVFHLGGGTLKIVHPDSQSHFKDKVNAKTCFVTFTITGKYTLSGGTGKYKNASGHGTYKVLEQGILRRTKAGACSQSAEPKIEVGYIRGSGPASLK